MPSQNIIQVVLDDPRWASKIVSGKNSNIDVHLTTFPGVVGGEFRAHVTGLMPDHFGQVDVEITCTGFDDDVSSDKFSSSLNSYFQEAASLSIHKLSFEIKFLIPFEAKGTEEGATWQLLIYLGDGTSEILEIPVCRTPKSNPEITSVQIAAAGVVVNDKQKNGLKKTSKTHHNKSYMMTRSNGELTLLTRTCAPGRPAILAKGLGIFAGAWAVLMFFFYWTFKDGNGFVGFASITLFVLFILLLFMLFGVSSCQFHKDKLVIKHKLFGIPLNWSNVDRSDLAGFSTKYLTSFPSPGRLKFKYFVIGQTNKLSNVFISLQVFDQEEAWILAKELNDYLEIGKF